MTQFIAFSYLGLQLKRFCCHWHSYFFNSKFFKFFQFSSLYKCSLAMSSFKKNASLHSKYYHCGTRKHSTFLIAVMFIMTALYLVSFIGPIISRPLLGTSSVKTLNKIPVYSVLGYQTFPKSFIRAPFKSNSHKSIIKNGKITPKTHKLSTPPIVNNNVNPWWIGSHLLDKLMGDSKVKKDLLYSVPANESPRDQKDLFESFLSGLAMAPNSGPGRSLASFPWLNETASDTVEQCRNSVQGPHFVTDERGYFCQRAQLLANGCCDIDRQRLDNFLSPSLGDNNDNLGETYVPEYVGQDTQSELAITPPNVYDDITSHGIGNNVSHHLLPTMRSNRHSPQSPNSASALQSNNESHVVVGLAQPKPDSKPEPIHRESTERVVTGVVRYVCSTCGPDSCCAIYEHCVSCCLDPDRRATIHAVMARWGRGRDPALTAARDHFEACLARCRTWSGSVQHENAYRSPRAKHCFGPAMAPIDAVEAVVPNHVGSMNK